VTKIMYSLIMKEASDPFVTSNVYYVYQDHKVIDFFVNNTNIKTFLYNVTPSSGAHIKVLDKYDFERTFGNMYIDDRILVTNDVDTSIYTLHGMDDTLGVGVDTTTTSARSIKMKEGSIQSHSIYPNPTTRKLNIAGLETGSKVAVINLLGDVMEIREAWSNKMEIDLSAYSNGVYFIRVMIDRKAATYKFIKQ